MYGDEKYGYQLWDPKNRKVIRLHYDIIFYESSLYKDNFGGKSVERASVEHEKEFVEFDGENVRNGGQAQGEELDVPLQQSSPQQRVHTPVSSSSSESDDDEHHDANEDDEVQAEPATTPPKRRSRRFTKQPDRYSPSAHNLLLTDFDEPECYVLSSSFPHATQ